jgi:hypothetical protein
MNQEQIEQGAWDVFCAAPTLREGVQRIVAYMQGLQGGALKVTEEEWMRAVKMSPTVNQVVVVSLSALNHILAQRAIPAEVQGEPTVTPFVYEEAQQVQDDLVPVINSRLLSIMDDHFGAVRSAVSEADRIDCAEVMSHAALSVARPAILAERDAQWEKAIRAELRERKSIGNAFIFSLIYEVKRRLTQPPEPAARVSTHFNGVTDKFEVWLDGKMKWDHADNMAVRAMASGLIEELEAARQKAGAE